MSKRTVFNAPACLVAVVAMSLYGCSTPAPSQPPASAAEHTAAAAAPTALPISINAVMVSVIDHASHDLWEAEQEGRAPKTDDDWENLAEHATQVATAGVAIMLPGTGVNDISLTQQANWQKWSRDMSAAGMAALKASQAKSVEALLAANNQLVESCESCHKEFKPSIPSEGITHKHMHSTR